MNKIIRWQGLLVFLAVTGFLALILLVFLNTWIKLAIEQGGGRLVGAEVNVRKVEHSFSPFGLTLHEVQVTDKDKPTHNVVQLEQLSADVAFLPLLRNKIIVDQLISRGVAFDQRREKEGKVYQSLRESVSENLEERGVEMELPSVDEVLARSPLLTTQASEEARAAYEQRQLELSKRYESLPTEESLNEYKERLNALTETDYEDPAALLAAREEFDQVLDELRLEQQSLQDFKQSVVEARTDLGQNVSALRAAPGQDYDLLKGLVAGDAGAYSQVTEAVFGPKARAWSEKLFVAYDLVAPMLENRKEEEETVERLEGRWIEFTETGGVPDLLVRNAEVSVNWQEQSFMSLWEDITTDHETLGRPTTFSVDSNNTPLWNLLQIAGDFRFAAQGLMANQDWELAGVKLSDLNLSDAESLSGTLQSALLNSSGSLSITEGLLDGSGLINLASLDIAAEGSNNLTNVIADSLNRLNSLDINALISGLLDAPDFSISSNLDQQLQSALLDNISSADQAKLDELRSKLDALGADSLEESEAGLEQWSDWEALVDGSMASVQDMLGSQFNNAVDEQRDELRDRLNQSLFGSDDDQVNESP